MISRKIRFVWLRILFNSFIIFYFTLVFIQLLAIVLFDQKSLLSRLVLMMIIVFVAFVIISLIKISWCFLLIKEVYFNGDLVKIGGVDYLITEINCLKKSKSSKDLYLFIIGSSRFYFFAENEYETQKLFEVYKTFDFGFVFKYHKSSYIHKTVELFSVKSGIPIRS